jgi:hypothetical protein
MFDFPKSLPYRGVVTGWDVGGKAFSNDWKKLCGLCASARNLSSHWKKKNSELPLRFFLEYQKALSPRRFGAQVQWLESPGC